MQDTWLQWAEVDHVQVRDGAGVPDPDRHPPGTQPVAHAGPASRDLRRRMAPRAGADHPRRRRGRRARRERFDRHAQGFGDARPDRAGGVRAPRGIRGALRRDRGSHRQERQPQCDKSPTGPGRTSTRAARGYGCPVRSRPRWSTDSAGCDPHRRPRRPDERAGPGRRGRRGRRRAGSRCHTTDHGGPPGGEEPDAPGPGRGPFWTPPGSTGHRRS